jgi:putative transposase
LALSVDTKRALIDQQSQQITQERQCELLNLCRSSLYYRPRPASLQRQCQQEEDWQIMRLLDEQYTQTPFYGSRRIAVWLREQGYRVNRKRIRRLMHALGLQAVYPRPRLSVPHPEHRVYPYLLRGLKVTRVNQVWSSDITYVRLQRGYVYLVAVMDWFSRLVIEWELSITLDSSFCQEVLRRSLENGCPEIFNTDQGSQFTCSGFSSLLQQAQVRISMDGRGRALDNIFIERLWRSVKQEEVYLKEYQSPQDAALNLARYFRFYNEERPHQSLNYRTPASVYHQNGAL